MDKLTYGIFFNKNSGDGSGKKIAEKLARVLKDHQQKSIMLFADSVEAVIKKIISNLKKIDILVVIGGDGTINIAVTALVQSKIKKDIAVIPAGTVNNFAKRFGLAIGTDKAIENIADFSKQRKRRVGIAVCNEDKAVVSSLTFGNLADISNEVRQKNKQKFGKIVYIFKAIQHIGKNKSFLIRYVPDDGAEKNLKTWFALITTNNYIGGHKYIHSSPNKLHISLLNDIGPKQLLPYALFALNGNLHRSKNITHFEAERIVLTSKRADITTRIDGDKGPKFPLKIDYFPDYLSLIVPNKTDR